MLNLYFNENAEKSFNKKNYSLKTLIGLLFLRMSLFLVIQVIFYLFFVINNKEQAWEYSANWWPFSVIFTNLICIFILDKLLKRENRRFKDIFIYKKGTILKNYLLMSGILLLVMPIAFFPNYLLGTILFDSYNDAAILFFRPLPMWAVITTLIVFPMTMALGELTIYFGYIMPRLQIIIKRKWIAILLPALFLSLQHLTLPLLFDFNFMLWRSLMFLPFAIAIGLIIMWKPKLFPYILIGHIFIDIMTAISILSVSI